MRLLMRALQPGPHNSVTPPFQTNRGMVGKGQEEKRPGRAAQAEENALCFLQPTTRGAFRARAPPPPLLSATVGDEDLSDPTVPENKGRPNKPPRGRHIISRVVASL